MACRAHGVSAALQNLDCAHVSSKSALETRARIAGPPRSLVHVDAVTFELFDLGGGGIDQRVGEIREGACHCELFTDPGPVRVLGRAPGSSPSANLPVADPQQRFRLGLMRVLVDDQLDRPDLAVTVQLHRSLQPSPGSHIVGDTRAAVERRKSSRVRGFPQAGWEPTVPRDAPGRPTGCSTVHARLAVPSVSSGPLAVAETRSAGHTPVSYTHLR